MAAITVYRFEMYDIRSDQHVRSRRWGTREGIGRVQGALLGGTATEVDETAVDANGLTALGFDPNPRQGFQQTVQTVQRSF